MIGALLWLILGLLVLIAIQVTVLTICLFHRLDWLRNMLVPWMSHLSRVLIGKE